MTVRVQVLEVIDCLVDEVFHFHTREHIEDVQPSRMRLAGHYSSGASRP